MWIVTIKVLEESWLWPHCCVPFRLKAIKKPRFQEGTVTLVVNLGLGLRSSQHQPCGEAGSHALTDMIYRFWGREAGWKSQLIGWSQTMLEDSSWFSNQEEGQDLLVFRADPSQPESPPLRPLQADQGTAQGPSWAGSTGPTALARWAVAAVPPTAGRPPGRGDSGPWRGCWSWAPGWREACARRCWGGRRPVLCASLYGTRPGIQVGRFRTEARERRPACTPASKVAWAFSE